MDRELTNEVPDKQTRKAEESSWMKNTKCDDKENCECTKVKIKIDMVCENEIEDVVKHLHTHKDFQSNDKLNKIS